MKPLVLLVEDEEALLTVLRYNLEREGFEVMTATNGEEGLMMLDERHPDILLLDWMLPLVSGIEICRQVRRKPETRDIPVIMLTARGEEGDKIRALNSGADDYITKPFSPSELIARVQAVLRRSRPALAAEALTYGDIVMDLAAHRVFRGGKPVHLRPTEFRLLRFLIEHPGRVFSREQLLNAVWTHDTYIEPRTVDVHIRRLRKALNVGGKDDMIRTVRATGYSLESDGFAADAAEAS